MKPWRDLAGGILLTAAFAVTALPTRRPAQPVATSSASGWSIQGGNAELGPLTSPTPRPQLPTGWTRPTWASAWIELPTTTTSTLTVTTSTITTTTSSTTTITTSTITSSTSTGSSTSTFTSTHTTTATTTWTSSTISWTTTSLTTAAPTSLNTKSTFVAIAPFNTSSNMSSKDHWDYLASLRSTTPSLQFTMSRRRDVRMSTSTKNEMSVQVATRMPAVTEGAKVHTLMSASSAATSSSARSARMTITTTPMTTSTTTIATSTTSYCFEDSVAWEPLDMRGTSFTKQMDAEACRQQCLRTPSCFHFSFWATRGHCHLQDAFALRQQNRMDFVSGPFECWGGVGEFARLGPNQFLPKQLSCMQVGVAWEPTLEWRPNTMFKGSQIDKIRECQDLCARTSECAHFTMEVSTNTCRLSPGDAVPIPGVFNTISGPQRCEGAEAYATFMRKFTARWTLPSSINLIAGASLALPSAFLVGIAVRRYNTREVTNDLRMIRLIIHDDAADLGPE